jgi:hypothetical protein
VKGISPDETRDLIVSVGTHKASRRLTPVQVAKKINKSIEAGESIESVSDTISLSKSVIRSFLSLLRLPEKVQLIVGWGTDPTTVAFSSAIEITRLESDSEKISLAMAILENSLNLKDVTQAVQIHKRSNKTMEETIEAVLNQRPTIEKRHLIIGEITSPLVLGIFSHLDEVEKNDLLSRSLQRFGPGRPTYGSKVQDKFFVVVCDDLYFKELISLGEDIESAVTELLEKEIKL